MPLTPDDWRDDHDDAPDGLPPSVTCGGCERELDPRAYHVEPPGDSQPDAAITRWPTMPGYRPFAVQCSTCAHYTVFATA